MHNVDSWIISSHLCVYDVVPQPGSDPPELGDPGGDLLDGHYYHYHHHHYHHHLDGLHCGAQELGLEVVAEVGVSRGYPGEYRVIIIITNIIIIIILGNKNEKNECPAPKENIKKKLFKTISNTQEPFGRD